MKNSKLHFSDLKCYELTKASHQNKNWKMKVELQNGLQPARSINLVEIN